MYNYNIDVIGAMPILPWEGTAVPRPYILLKVMATEAQVMTNHGLFQQFSTILSHHHARSKEIKMLKKICPVSGKMVVKIWFLHITYNIL